MTLHQFVLVYYNGRSEHEENIMDSSNAYQHRKYRKRGRKQLYNWSEWFKHRSFVIKKYLDYFIGNGAMMQQVRNEARKRGLLVSLVEGDLEVTVTVTGPPEVLGELLVNPHVVSAEVSE